MTGPDHDRDTDRDTTIAGDGDYTVTFTGYVSDKTWNDLAADLDAHRREQKGDA